MKPAARTREASLVASIAAPEDLRAGEFVAILNETREYPSFLWEADPITLPPDRPVRVRWRTESGGRPLKVRAVCLPVVCLEDPGGVFATIDVRQVECVRLHRRYARFVWRKLRRQVADG